MLPYRIYALLIVFLGLSVFPTPGPSAAERTIVPRHRHEWGRFRHGAWKRVRIVTEMLDEKGRTARTSTTETTTSLVSATDEAVTLRIEVMIDVAGKRFFKSPRKVLQGYSGEIRGHIVSLKKLEPGSVTIDGKNIPSEIRQIVVNGDAVKWTSTIHYSDSVAPYVLRRKTVSSDAQGKTTHYQTLVQVIAKGMPYKVLSEIKNTSYIKTVHTSPNSKTITIEIRCEDVPGGVVAHTSKELDSMGQTVRRTTLELIDYGIGKGRIDKEQRRRAKRDRRICKLERKRQ